MFLRAFFTLISGTEHLREDSKTVLILLGQGLQLLERALFMKMSFSYGKLGICLFFTTAQKLKFRLLKNCHSSNLF